MLARGLFLGEDGIIEEIAAPQQPDHADPRIQHHAQSQKQPRYLGGNHHAGCVDVEDQRIENEPRGENDPGLKPAAGPEVAAPG